MQKEVAFELNSKLLLASILLTVPFAALFPMPSYALAYQQPLEGFSWPTRLIPVTIDSTGPEYAQASVLKAMTVWNLAQVWFASAHGPSKQYSLVEVVQPGDSYVKVIFNRTQSREDWGYTWYNYWWDSNGVFYRITATISLDLSLSSGRDLTPLDLQAVAAHEFGHAIGLGHTTFSETDLMNHFSPKHDITLPSTLNLYALAMLSIVTSKNNMPPNPLALPQNIPYLTTPESAVPEIASPLIFLVLAMMIAVNFLRFGRRKSQTLRRVSTTSDECTSSSSRRREQINHSKH